MAIAITTGTKKIKEAICEPTFYKVIQGGACFVGSTKILMADGSYKRIVDVHSGDKVLSRGEDGGIIETEVKRAWYAGDRKPLLKIKVNGRMIEATYDHKFYTSRGYKELYKIAWGKMEKSQRLQLQVLCKQYGQDFHLEEIWGETQPSDNETLCVYRQETRTAQRILQDAAGRKEYPGASGSSNNLVAKSRKQATSKSQKRHHYGQPSGEFRMGNQFGKSTPRLQDRSIATQNGGEEYKCFNDGRGSADDKNAMGHRSREIITQGICEEVWGIRGNDKGHFREQKLEAFAIDEIQVAQPQKVYSLEIDHPTHNYFVSDTNINVSNSASKTFSIMILLIGYAESYPNSLITVAGMTYNHLATGTMRDLKKILQETNRWDNERFNKTEKIYTFPNGSQIEFLSVDNMTSRGPRRDVLFVNEANGLNYETFDQLATRTRDFVIIDYNPSAKFWAHEELVEGKQKDRTTFLTLTYLDNEALSQQERENIESRKPKPGEEPSNYWIVYGLGQIGSLEGNIYQNWIAEKEMPEGFILKRRGVDFGFSNDPTAVVDVYENENKEIFVETMIYEKGLLTPELIEKMKRLPETLAVCDNARPEIIAEMKRSGLRAIACDKTAGEKMNGKRYNIELVQRRIVHYLKSDQDLEREYLSYAWRKKRSTGEYLDEPEDGNDHDLDALSYAIRDMARHKIQF